MSRGKYSPNYPYNKDYRFNAKGELPVPYHLIGNQTVYDEETMNSDHDDEGFDRYGYSAYDEDGTYVGIGDGVDRNGYTEFEYLTMSEEEFQRFC